ILATIGNTAPFIGLFGTVVGMMTTLQSITAAGTTDLNVVAGPIGEALIATAAGIACAIPAVVAYNSFLRHLRVFTTSLDSFAYDSLMHLASEEAMHLAGHHSSDNHHHHHTEVHHPHHEHRHDHDDSHGGSH
ncbi:MAG: MotA/TolQ/ExbB proton channel family protein, partial [Gammaproteobacteria bacterium]|nr:MotA/TolQ/ExbB proton channel family protein [Gammaproteobacteria bacterium]